MTDLEMTKLCAEAMGYHEELVGEETRAIRVREHWPAYDPLGDDAQAMALVKKFCFVIERDPKRSDYFGVTLFPERVAGRTQPTQVVRYAPDLNRAIVECVAKMQKAKELG